MNSCKKQVIIVNTRINKTIDNTVGTKLANYDFFLLQKQFYTLKIDICF